MEKGGKGEPRIANKGFRMAFEEANLGGGGEKWGLNKLREGKRKGRGARHFMWHQKGSQC